MYFRFLCLLFPAALAAQGIQFENTTWSATLSKADARKKLVFLSVSTAACDSCRQMEGRVFADSGVSQFYNAHFINARIDLEKGEGPVLAKRYKLRTVPAWVFLDGHGDVVHRAFGYLAAEQFLALGTSADDPAQHPRGLDLRYTRGDRDPAFLVRYLAAKAAANEPDLETLAVECLTSQTDWATPECRQIIQSYITEPQSPPFTYFMNNRTDFVAQFGKEAVLRKSEQSMNRYLTRHVELSLEESQSVIRQIVGGEEGERMAEFYALRYYRRRGAFDLYPPAAEAYFLHYPQAGANELNEVARVFADHIEEPAWLQTALLWAKKSVALQPGYENAHTLATLYARLGNKTEAVKYARKAIDLAKKAKVGYADAQHLLESLQR